MKWNTSLSLGNAKFLKKLIRCSCKLHQTNALRLAGLLLHFEGHYKELQILKNIKKRSYNRLVEILQDNFIFVKFKFLVFNTNKISRIF